MGVSLLVSRLMQKLGLPCLLKTDFHKIRCKGGTLPRKKRLDVCL